MLIPNLALNVFLTHYIFEYLYMHTTTRFDYAYVEQKITGNQHSEY